MYKIYPIDIIEGNVLQMEFILICVSEMIEHTSIKYDRLMSRLTQPLQQHFGINYFCYQFVSHEGLWVTLGNRPDWIIHSAAHQFYQYDPSLVRPSLYQPMVCLPKYHQHEEFQETLIDHAINLFDIDHCLAVIEPCVNGCEYYFFGAPKDHTKVLNIYLTQIARLRHDFTRYIKTNIQTALHHSLDHGVNLIEFNPEGFYSMDNILSADSSSPSESDFLSTIHKSPQLTHREKQCLTLYQQGFTAKQTARHLNLSYRTIEDHFEHIKKKYDVENKRELLRSLI